jgi:hypothetical protein
MNATVTSHQPVCLYSPAGEEGEPPNHVYRLNGGPASAWNILIVFYNKLREGIVRTNGIPKPSYYLRIELVMKKRSSTVNGLLLVVFFFTKNPQNKDTIGKVVLKISLFLPKVLKTKTSLKSNDGKCRSWHQLQFRSSTG